MESINKKKIVQTVPPPKAVGRHKKNPIRYPIMKCSNNKCLNSIRKF